MRDSESVMGRTIKLEYGPAKNKSYSNEKVKQSKGKPLGEVGGMGSLRQCLLIVTMSISRLRADLKQSPSPRALW
jgi:hypothetical protein